MINSYSENTMSNCLPPLDKQNIAGQQPPKLTASTSGPSTLPAQTRHKSTKSQVAARSPSPAIEGKSVRNSTLTGHPAAGDPVPPDDARTKASTLTRVALPKAATLAAQTDQLQDDFRDPWEIPGYKKKMNVYWHADAHISDTHKKRFPDILELFRLQLLTDKKLSKLRPADTEYKLKLCGLNPQETRPSILISHPLLDIGIGRLIYKRLTKRSLREQYEYRCDNTRPAFEIYLFFPRNFWMLGDSMKSLSIYVDEDPFVGAQLVSNDEPYQISTITCGLSFVGNDTIFALTSAHAFEDNGNEKSDKPVSNHDDSTSDCDSSESDDIRDHRFSGTDDEYDWDELEAAAAKERQESGFNDPNNPAPSRHRDEEHPSRSEIKPSQVWGRPNDPQWALQPNLDWALVEIPSLGVPVGNSFVTPSDLPETLATVVVAAPSGLRKGTLASIPSYISSSRKSATLTKIWTVTLEDNEQGCLHKGDSGSPVLNLTHDRIYGYVTALNYFDELHVMPLQAVLDQIWEMVQPLETNPKLRTISRIGPKISNDHKKTSAKNSLHRDRLFQYWPKEVVVEPEIDHWESTLPPPHNAGNDQSILKAVAARLEDNDWFVRDAAAETLGKQVTLPEDILNAVAARLEDEVGSVRRAAVETLGKQVTLPEDVLKVVLLRLEDKVVSVRRAAVEVLGKQVMMHKDIPKVVTALLEDKDWYIRCAAIETLGKQARLPEDVLKVIAARLEDKDRFVRDAAAEALGKQVTLPEDVLKVVISRLEDKVGSVRRAAVKTLGKQATLSEDILKVVISRLEDKDEPVLRAAAETLGKQIMLPEDILNAIAALLEDKNGLIRCAAIETLDRQATLPEDFLKIIAARLEDEDSSVQYAAVKTLGKQATLSEGVLKVVISQLEDKEESVRYAAVETLGKQATLSEDILNAVVSRLEDKDSSVRYAAVKTLGKQATLSEDILNAVAARLEDEVGSVRRAAIEILGKQVPLPEDILKVVAARLKDKDWFIRNAADRILRKQVTLPGDILKVVAARPEVKEESVRRAADKTLPEDILKIITARLEWEDRFVQAAAFERRVKIWLI